MEQQQEHLWRKESHYFVIEIKVGNTWVEKGRASSEDEALSKGSKALRSDPSIKAARVLSNQISHSCSSVWEEEAGVITKLPPRMTYTGRTQSCPKCKTDATVANDGTTDWVFCGKCDGAFPA